MNSKLDGCVDKCGPDEFIISNIKCVKCSSKIINCYSCDSDIHCTECSTLSINYNFFLSLFNIHKKLLF